MSAHAGTHARTDEVAFGLGVSALLLDVTGPTASYARARAWKLGLRSPKIALSIRTRGIGCLGLRAVALPSIGFARAPATAPTLKPPAAARTPSAAAASQLAAGPKPALDHVVAALAPAVTKQIALDGLPTNVHVETEDPTRHVVCIESKGEYADGRRFRLYVDRDYRIKKTDFYGETCRRRIAGTTSTPALFVAIPGPSTLTIPSIRERARPKHLGFAGGANVQHTHLRFDVKGGPHKSPRTEATRRTDESSFRFAAAATHDRGEGNMKTHGTGRSPVTSESAFRLSLVGALALMLASCSVLPRALREVKAGDRELQLQHYDLAAAHYAAAEHSAEHRRVVAQRWNTMGETYEAIPSSQSEAHRYYKRAIAVDPTLPGPRLAIARMKLSTPELEQCSWSAKELISQLEDEERLAPGRPEVAKLTAGALRLRERKENGECERAYGGSMANARWHVGRVQPAVIAPTYVVDPQPQQVGALTCSVAGFKVWGAPDRANPSGSITAYRLHCKNSTKRSARLKSSEVNLIDSDGDQFQPDEDADNFEQVFDSPAPQFVEKFVDVKAGGEVDIGFTFTESYDRRVDAGLILDVNGTRFQTAGARK